MVRIWWDEIASAHLRDRPLRHLGGRTVEPKWAAEAAEDTSAVIRDPDPVSRTGAARLVGYCPTIDRVLVVIYNAETGRGYTAWPATGADLRRYVKGAQ